MFIFYLLSYNIRIRILDYHFLLLLFIKVINKCLFLIYIISALFQLMKIYIYILVLQEQHC